MYEETHHDPEDEQLTHSVNPQSANNGNGGEPEGDKSVSMVSVHKWSSYK